VEENVKQGLVGRCPAPHHRRLVEGLKGF